MTGDRRPDLSKRQNPGETLMQESDELKRILWKCRRGARELDLTLENFVRWRYQGLSSTARAEFQSLLEYDDSLLIDWLCHQKKPDVPEVRDIVSRIWSASCGRAR